MSKKSSPLVAVSAVLLGLAAGAVSLSAQAGPRLDAIMQAKVLRVGTPGDYRPFAMKADGKYAGHDIEVIEAMAKEMGVKVQYVDTTWPKLMADLQENKFDVAVGGITRNVARISKVQMLPGYAPFGKVALVRAADKDKFTTPEALNQASVRVIKNPGGTNEAYVLQNMQSAQISTHDKNAEIPALIARRKVKADNHQIGRMGQNGAFRIAHLNTAGSHSDNAGTNATASSTASAASQNGQMVFSASPMLIRPMAVPTNSTEPTGGVTRPMPPARISTTPNCSGSMP